MTQAFAAIAPGAMSWPVARLADVTEAPVLYGILQPGPDLPDGVPYVRPTEINGDQIVLSQIRRTSPEIASKYKRSVLKTHDIILSIVGTIGKVAIVPPDLDGGNITQSSVRIRPKPDLLLPQFLAWFLRSPFATRQYDAARLGTAVPRLNVAHVRDLQIPLPPLDEQRRIVEEVEQQFTRLDAGVAALRSAQTKLKRYRAAVLKAACEGKLVPTEAELARKEGRGYESGAELLDRMLAEGQKNKIGPGKHEPASPDAENLPTLPQGWRWAPVGQVGRVQLGRQRSPKNHSGNFMRPYLRVANVFEDRIDLADVKEMNFTPEEFRIFGLKPNDILLNEGQSLELVGRPALYRSEVPGACFQNTLVRFSPGPVVEPRFALIVFRGYFHLGRFQKIAKWTTTMAHLGANRFAQLGFPVPPLAEQARIVAEVERCLSLVDELAETVKADLKRALGLRNSILHAAFSGQVSTAAKSSTIKPSLTKTSIRRPNRHFARAVLSAEIVHQLHMEPTFGRIKHQKIFHLCEHIAQLNEIEGQYHREAAGPLDNKLIYANEAELRKQKWYGEEKRKSFGHSYRPLAKAGAHQKYLEQFWPEQYATILRLIDLMRKWDTGTCEIFCTAYAAWNDLLIWGKEPNDEAILDQVLNHWHNAKRRFPRKRWLKAIRWMKKEAFTPNGFGRATTNKNSK